LVVKVPGFGSGMSLGLRLDEALRDQLEKHLSALKHQGIIEAWHDRRILAGQTFSLEIDSHLESADIISVARQL